MLTLTVASLGHVAVGLLAGRMHGGRSPREVYLVMLGFAGLSMLPDFDVGWVALGLPDEGAIGHRGFTHSMPFAAAVGIAVGLVGRSATGRPWSSGLLAFMTVASHGFLDAMTETTRGIAFLWPLSDERIAYAWRPIPPSPTGMAFLSWQGCQAAGLELIYFSPLFLFALWPRGSPGTPPTPRAAVLHCGVMVMAIVSCLYVADLTLRDLAVVDWLHRGATQVASGP